MKTRRWMNRCATIVWIAVFSFAVPVQGQQCPEYLGELGVRLWAGAPDRMEVSGSFAYLGSPKKCMVKPSGCFGSTIAIADVSVPEEPRFVSFLGVRTLLDFTVSGSRLYHHSMSVGRGGRGDDYLGIIDVSDASHPATLMSDYQIDGLHRITVSGDRVFAATSSGLMVLDASDPSNPVEVGFHASPWSPSDLVVEGEFAFIAVPDSGLSVIDVSDPANPVEIGSWTMTWEALDLEVQDGFAYVADGAGGLRVIDVTDPTEPAEVGILETAFEASKVSVAGAVATVVLRESFFRFVDVSDPANPQAIGLVATEGTPLAAFMSGPMVYISEGTEFSPVWGDFFTDGRFLVVDLSDPAMPVELASSDYHSTAMDVAVAEGVQYVASGDTGLVILDHSNPDEPVETFLDTPGVARGVTLRGDLALVADDHKGLRLIDVADPMNIAEVGFFDTPGQARSVAVGDDYA